MRLGPPHRRRGRAPRQRAPTAVLLAATALGVLLCAGALAQGAFWGGAHASAAAARHSTTPLHSTTAPHSTAARHSNKAHHNHARGRRPVKAKRFVASGVLSDPIDPKYLTEVPFGTSSFWIQPWRSYMDTWPASRLLDSLGINFNVGEAEAQDTAQLLQNSGFTLARIEISWNDLSYEDPSSFADEGRIRALLQALRDHDLRPLILLNANSGEPTPTKALTLTTTVAAPAGARTVTLTPASAAQVIPGRSGFNRLGFGGSADILITKLGAGHVATLSKPLPKALAAGAHNGATLLYAPFGAPLLASGAPNPAFQATLGGWLGYVGTVSKLAASIFGPEGYDLEVWNELSFGSQFLDQENYYSPTRETGSGSATKALLEATVAYVRNPASGISPAVGITDGFASETPFASGALLPAGLTAMSKHLYNSPKTIPSEYAPEAGIKPLGALGQPDFQPGAGKTTSAITPLFTPSYRSDFPEYFLSATQTETAIRDLAPTTTTIYGVPHGRSVSPPGQAPPQIWMTEYNLAPTSTTAIGTGAVPTASLPAAEQAHLQAMALLRSLVAMVSKGMTREYFFAAANAGALSMIPHSFISAASHRPGAYPGDRMGGEVMSGFRNLLAGFRGPGPLGAARQLQLTSIAQQGDQSQFTGDGTPAHPTLYDREVLAVFPFQSSPTRFVIPVYVMTRDLSTIYRPKLPASDPLRYDLPDETFRITLGDLPRTARPPRVLAYDPLRRRRTPARLVHREGTRATFQLAVTDYPRLLTIEYPSRG